MPLGVREVLLVVRAKDAASRTINDVGRSIHGLGKTGGDVGGSLVRLGGGLMAVGAGVGSVGAAGLAFFASAGKEAAKYRQEAALTLTQVDQAGVTLKNIEDIGIRVARAIPAPLDQMQKSLFDIFSSMDVDLKGSEKLLRGFAKAGVGGQVDMQEAARATIAIMNAYKIPADQVNKVLDFQFQLVRKGVGTYGEFASTIGLAIPSAVNAGQSIEQLGGMLAFLTRNGLSASRAATSSARALDALTNPKVLDRLQKMGINIKDAKGNFLPMTDIVGKLADKFGHLSETARNQALTDLFKGAGGTIQAMRFFKVAIPNFDQLNQRVKEMVNSAGAADQAYKIMFRQPQTQVARFTNSLKILRITIGREFLPALSPMLKFGQRIIDWFLNLDEHTRKTIIRWAFFAAAFLTAAGALLFIVGALVAVVGGLTLLTGSVGVAIGILSGLFALLVVIPLAGYLIYKNWDTLSKKGKEVWGAIQGYLRGVSSWLKRVGPPAWNAVTSAASSLWTGMKRGASDAWQVLKAIGGFFADMFKGIQPVLESFGSIWNSIMKSLGAAIGIAWTIIKPIVLLLAAEFQYLIIPALRFFMTVWWNVMKEVAKAISWWWHNVVYPTLKFFIQYLGIAWDAIKFFGTVAFEIFKAVYEIVAKMWEIVATIFDAFYQVLKALLGPAIDWFGNKVVVPVFKAIASIVSWMWNTVVKPVFGAIATAVKTVLAPVFDTLARIWGAAWDAAGKAIEAVWEGIKKMVAGSVNILMGFVETIINGLIKGINTITGVLNKIPGVHIDKIEEIHLPRINMQPIREGGTMIGPTKYNGRFSAEGFMGTVSRPTTLIAGEAGTEDVAIMPHAKGGFGSMSGTQYHFHFHGDIRPNDWRDFESNVLERSRLAGAAGRRNGS